MGVINGRVTNTTTPVKNAVTAVQTVITTTATKINLPDTGTQFVVRHVTEDAVLWFGDNASIVVGGTDVAPLLEYDTLQIDLSAGNGNELYGVVASGTLTVYAVSEVSQ